jgi:hypothetical protein
VPDGEARTRAADKPSASFARDAARLLALGGALLAVTAYRAVGASFYGGFSLPQGVGMNGLLPAEVSAFAVFIVFGAVAWVLLTVALRGTALVQPAVGAVSAIARGRGVIAAAVVALLLSVACWTVAHVFLRHAVTSDDEHVYQFIGQTLAGGRLTAPSPGQDLAFYREQFVVLTEHVRFGKYPVGFPALLALGQVMGVETAVVPVIVGLVAIGVFWLARTVGTPGAALVALLLFASSPQVLLTGGTLVSQPAAALCLTVGVASLVASARGRSRSSWASLAGAAFGYGLLVRPLPGVLFAAAALAWLAWEVRSEAAATRLRLGLALAGPMAIAMAVLLLVNRLQVGNALSSGYQAFHGTSQSVGGLREFLGGDLALRSMSVFASLFRLDVWLFGWPLSLVFLAFAPRQGPWRLLWVMVGAELSYRLISAKAGVGATGPVYMFEAVPLLCVLSAQGAVRAHRGLGTLRPPSAGTVPAAMLGGALVALTMFLPDRLGDLGRMGAAQRTAPELIARRGLTHALVFHEGIVPPWTYRSWAYFPRCNAPAMDDDVLYVRFQRSPDGVTENLDFWRRRHPDRTAWYFGWPPDGEPYLIDLDTFVRGQAGAPR